MTSEGCMMPPHLFKESKLSEVLTNHQSLLTSWLPWRPLLAKLPARNGSEAWTTGLIVILAVMSRFICWMRIHVADDQTSLYVTNTCFFLIRRFSPLCLIHSHLRSVFSAWPTTSRNSLEYNTHKREKLKMSTQINKTNNEILTNN